MTRKDYVKIAEVLWGTAPHDFEGEDVRGQFNEIVDDFCIMLGEDNSNFNKDKFKEEVYK